MKSFLNRKNFFVVVLCASVLGLAAEAAEGEWSEEQKLLASDGAADDFFGASISISGDYAIIGAYRDNDNGSNSGSAYIFKWNGDPNDPNWYERCKLTASDAAAGDLFGWSVSVDRDYAIVGAEGDDYDGFKSGSAYIFKWSDDPNDPNWYEQVKLIPSDSAANKYFGRFVSISGGYAVVGAFGDRSSYIFKRSDVPGDPNWYEQAKLTPSGGSDYYFGWSGSISGDYVIVGTKANSVYIFKRDGTGWIQQDMLTNDGEFGRSVSISGDYAIVGAGEDWDVINGPYSGSAYIFTPNDLDPNNWDQQARLTASDGAASDLFGVSVYISGDYAIIGAYRDKAYIFKRDGTNWIQQTKLIASDDEAAWDRFGLTVAIEEHYAIVGAKEDDDNGSNSGSAYVFMMAEPNNTVAVACIVGGDQTVEAGVGCEARVTLDGSCSSDVDSTPGTNDDIVYFDWYEQIDPCDPNSDIFLGSGEIIECNLPLGEHTIILEVIDKADTFDANEVTITVEDTTPPEFSLAVTPTMLWPVNHKMVKITPNWEISDNCDESPEVTLVSVTIDGDNGQTNDDIQMGDDGIWLRAERSGTGTSRIYTITYQAVDDSGNVTVESATVTVPHDKRRAK